MCFRRSFCYVLNVPPKYIRCGQNKVLYVSEEMYIQQNGAFLGKAMSVKEYAFVGVVLSIPGDGFLQIVIVVAAVRICGLKCTQSMCVFCL